jgi:hypothetical protein
MGHLPLEAPARLRRHFRQRRPEPCGDGGCHRSLHERSLAEEHALALLRIQQIERGLGAQHRAAEVHEHEHAVTGVGARDRLHHANRVRAERLGLSQPARELEPHVRAGHLRRELPHSGGQGRAVRDDDDADHDRYAASSP